jgi:hypothetical protein
VELRVLRRVRAVVDVVQGEDVGEREQAKPGLSVAAALGVVLLE